MIAAISRAHMDRATKPRAPCTRLPPVSDHGRIMPTERLAAATCKVLGPEHGLSANAYASSFGATVTRPYQALRGCRSCSLPTPRYDFWSRKVFKRSWRAFGSRDGSPTRRLHGFGCSLALRLHSLLVSTLVRLQVSCLRSVFQKPTMTRCSVEPGLLQNLIIVILMVAPRPCRLRLPAADTAPGSRPAWRRPAASRSDLGGQLRIGFSGPPSESLKGSWSSTSKAAALRAGSPSRANKFWGSRLFVARQGHGHDAPAGTGTQRLEASPPRRQLSVSGAWQAPGRCRSQLLHSMYLCLEERHPLPQ